MTTTEADIDGDVDRDIDRDVDWDLARIIDHTLLRPEALPAEIEALCAEALRYRFAAVCVQPALVRCAAGALARTPVKAAAVVAFPHGAATTDIKVAETRRARADGASEIDVVANLAWIRAGALAALAGEVRAIVDAAEGAAVKVILETALFPDAATKTAAARAAVDGGAAFVKTSTGFGPGGATPADVALLRSAVGPAIGVKASGGIRTRAQALALVAAGANRLGASASVVLVTP